MTGCAGKLGLSMDKIAHRDMRILSSTGVIERRFTVKLSPHQHEVSGKISVKMRTKLSEDIFFRYGPDTHREAKAERSDTNRVSCSPLREQLRDFARVSFRCVILAHLQESAIDFTERDLRDGNGRDERDRSKVERGIVREVRRQTQRRDDGRHAGHE